MIPSLKVPVVVDQILSTDIMNNSLINPWIYAVQSQEFRVALKENLSKVLLNTALKILSFLEQ